jgi:glycosyltransferase involved in cell wall biosynthesis
MLAILATHPIQYQVPLWQALAREGSIPFEVWYLSDHGTRPSFDKQFGKTFSWDVDTLAGYPHRFLKASQDLDVSNFAKARVREPLPKLFKDRKVTALWVQGWQVAAYWQAVWQAYEAGIPVWLRGDSNDLARVSIWKKMSKRILLGQFFHRTKHFLYVGKSNRRFYEAYGIRPEQLHPAPHCVDNERFAIQSESLRAERESIRRAWGIPDNAFCILFAGKLIPKKRPFDLVTAVRQCHLRQSKRPLHLLFAGSGELGDELRKACHVVFDAENPAMNRGSVQAQDRERPSASFAGFLNQTEISKAYVAADCKVLPSDQRETWGLVVNEALASGLPCIVSDACGCSEDLISPINPKFRFPLGDIGAMVDALLLLMEHPCSSSALQEQVSRFSINASVDTVKRLYPLTKKIN